MGIHSGGVGFGSDRIIGNVGMAVGKSAVSSSIFDAKNRAWLNLEYGIEILNVQQLAQLL
jgi:hypothetical protein